jgi:hypothetical protein
MAADELRRQADTFIDIVTLQSKIGRDPSERPPRPPRDDHGEPSQHTPQFLHRAPGAPQRTAEPVGAADEFDDE